MHHRQIPFAVVIIVVCPRKLVWPCPALDFEEILLLSRVRWAPNDATPSGGIITDRHRRQRLWHQKLHDESFAFRDEAIVVVAVVSFNPLAVVPFCVFGTTCHAFPSVFRPGGGFGSGAIIEKT